VSFAKLKSP